MNPTQDYERNAKGLFWLGEEGRSAATTADAKVRLGIEVIIQPPPVTPGQQQRTPTPTPTPPAA